MKEYKEYQPTEWDAKGIVLHDQGNWLVAPCGRNRDSRVIDESNWDVLVNLLTSECGDEGEENGWEVHRFGNWACGWFEILIVAPGSKAHEICADIERRLESYPILNEDDVTTREWECATEYWASLEVSERRELCKRFGVPVKFARRKSLPDDDDGALYDHLTSDC